MIKMKKILLTGCAGFIGAKTTEKLLEQNIEVIGIDNMNDYYHVTYKKKRLDQLKKYPHFKFIKGDIEDTKILEKIITQNKDISAIINLAARAGCRISHENPSIYYSANTLGSLNLLELMRHYKIKKYVLASTSSVYAGSKMPFKENLPVNTPISPYAASKKAAELMAYTYHHLFKIDISIVRYFTVYGPGGRPDMSIFRFIKWIDEGTPIELFGDGNQSRDFTYIDDIANGTILALKKIGYEIINLGGGQNPISLNQVIAHIEKKLEKKTRIHHKTFQKTDFQSSWADISKAKKLLDWEPKIPLEEGLRRTIDWYIKNREWLQKLPV